MTIGDVLLNEIRHYEFQPKDKETLELKQILRDKDKKISELSLELGRVYKSRFWKILSFYKKIFK